MSKPCAALDALLIDAGCLADPAWRAVAREAAGLALRLVAVSRERPPGEAVAAAGLDDVIGLWLAGEGAWPLERALALIAADPEQVLAASPNARLRQAAAALGMRVAATPAEALETLR